MPLALPPPIWLPPEPAIIRPAPPSLLRKGFLPGIGWLGGQAYRRLMYLGGTSSGGSASSITLSNIDISRVPLNAYIIVAGHGNDSNSRSVSGVTIGGAAATSIVTSGFGNRPSALFGLKRPTGTTTTVVVTFSGAMARGRGVHVWAIMTPSLTPTDTATDTAASSGVLSATIDTVANGVMIGAASFYQGASSVSWSGLTLDDTNNDSSANLGTYSGASKAALAAATGGTVTATCSGANSVSTMVLATWS